MSPDARSSPGTADVIWLCRRLASALQSDASILSGLDAVAEGAPAGVGEALASIRGRIAAGGRIADALDELGWGPFASGMARTGELTNDLAGSLELVARTLEAELALAAPRNREVRAFGVAFGRLGAMLRAGVPVLTALECAADSVPRTKARGVLTEARSAVRAGADLSDALEQLAPDLPDMTIEMVRDGEHDGRLGEALAVIADYLFDESGQRRARARRQEVQNA